MWHFPPVPPPPRPGAWLTLAKCTLAPRSLSQSKLSVPNTKLLPLAKEEKIKEREDAGVRMETELKGKSNLPHAHSPEGTSDTGSNLEVGSGQNVYLKFFYDVSHFCSTNNKIRGHFTKTMVTSGPLTS